MTQIFVMVCPNNLTQRHCYLTALLKTEPTVNVNLAKFHEKEMG